MKKIICLVISALFISCGGSEKEQESKKDGFNRKEMLTFWADDIIMPAYNDFNIKTKSLDDAIKIFIQKPTTRTLSIAKNKWKQAYISWQKVSLFQIGKAEELYMIGNMNTYPTDVESLKKYAEKGEYILELPSLYDEQGFPALDYLLNGIGTEQETVNFYKNSTNVNYLKYLKDISARINNLANQVYNDWKGGYRDIFISKDGYSITGSVTKMVNFYVIPFYEKQFRENKISTPTGVRTGTVAVEKVEAYYAKNISKELYMVTLEAIKNFFKGKSYDGTKTGKSLQQYLQFLKREDLVKVINTKFEKLTELSNSLDDDFVKQIETDRKKMVDIFNAIQSVLKSFKPDMMSAMSVTNTSTDTDND
ncbi:MAG: imelysin family protein [Tenacibaculum sp.]|nr:imelysin family protein [Tenacibaculum sp.]